MHVREYTIDDFRELNELEIGGDGIVSSACEYKDNQFIRKVAIKEFYRSIKRNDLDSEIQLLINNSDSHIVQVYGVLCSSKENPDIILGYVMEFMENQSLHKVIHSQIEYDYCQVYSWLKSAAEALRVVHSQGIFHRDIKPKNMLIGNVLDQLKLSDFGSANKYNPGLSSTNCVGTCFYMAPETIATTNYSLKTDLFSLTITFWEMLHRRGWDKNAENRPTIEEFIQFAEEMQEIPGSKTKIFKIEESEENSNSETITATAAVQLANAMDTLVLSQNHPTVQIILVGCKETIEMETWLKLALRVYQSEKLKGAPSRDLELLIEGRRYCFIGIEYGDLERILNQMAGKISSIGLFAQLDFNSQANKINSILTVLPLLGQTILFGYSNITYNLNNRERANMMYPKALKMEFVALKSDYLFGKAMSQEEMALKIEVIDKCISLAKRPCL